MQLDALPYSVVTVRVHLVVCDGKVELRIVDDNVCILADSDHAFVLAAEYLCRVFRAELYSLLKSDLTLACCRKHIRIHILNACTAVGDLCEIVDAPVLFGRLERAVVCCDGVDVASPDSFPDSVLTFLAFHRR